MNACGECGRLHLCQISCRLYKALPYFLVLWIASVDLIILYWEICGFAAVLATRSGYYLMGTERVDIKMVFKVCKSVHHRTIQINHQPDATVFQFITLTFIYRSTCFGRSPAHRQELNDCIGSLWFYLRIVVITVLCSWSGRL